MHPIPDDARPPASDAGPPRPGLGSYLLFGGAAAWIITTTVFVQGVAWLVDQVLLITADTPLPGFGWLAVAWGHGLLLALPVLPLARLTRAPRLRVAYRAWAWAIGCAFAFGLVRLLPGLWTQPAALAQGALALALAFGLLVYFRARGAAFSLRAAAVIPALTVLPLVALPTLIWGALGSPTDTVLNLVAGLSLGLLAGVLIAATLIQPGAEASGPARGVSFEGLAAGVALLILGAGFGFGGSQLLLMISFPALGFALISVARYTGEGGEAQHATAWLPIAVLAGGAAAAPLMLVDPKELTLLLGGSDILTWALRAAGLSVLLAWAAGGGLWLLRPRDQRPPRTGLRALALAFAWLGGLLAYGFAGQPGFYGEQLFVILRAQADVSPAYGMAARTDRLRFVFTTLTEHAEATQADLRSTLDRVGAEYQPYYLINALEVNGGPLVRAYLSLQPEVERILDSPHLRPLPAPVPVSLGSDGSPRAPQWNLTSIGADRVWGELGVTGAGIVVGQSDSGVQGDHPALAEGYRGRGGVDDYHWLDPWNHTSVPTDIGGHGTHTLGSVLGRGGIGVAPGAEWIGCVNLARNLGNPALYLECMQFMLAPYPQGGDPFTEGDPARAAHVLNNSWGCPPLEGCDANALRSAVSALRAAGLFVVASAGNTGPRCGSVSDPIALYDDVFSVGAVDAFGNVAPFSSRGPVDVDGSGRLKPDLVAPGVDVLSAMPGGTYGVNSGTSMAGPHVAGAVALMWSANPGLIGDVERTEWILVETARPYTGDWAPGCFEGAGPNTAFGYGLLDAYAAVSEALTQR